MLLPLLIEVLNHIFIDLIITKTLVVHFSQIGINIKLKIMSFIKDHIYAMLYYRA